MPPRIYGALYLAFFLSGAAALFYQISWERLLALSIGGLEDSRKNGGIASIEARTPPERHPPWIRLGSRLEISFGGKTDCSPRGMVGGYLK
jgi:hypothetical protein